MNEYLKKIHPQTRKYFSVLSDEIPSFLEKHFEIPELKRLQDVGYLCGMDYCSKAIYDFPYFYSRFDHSLAVALMTWNFTQNKTQTIAALLHDISTPVFSHVIDYMNDDHINQESTEERTEDIINGSTQLLDCLKQDSINTIDITDCKKYSIIDNDRPKLCCDRLDSLFMTNVLWTKKLKFNEIKEIYENITVLTNENGESELGSLDIKTASKIADLSLDVGYATNSNEDKLSMQLLADILKLCDNYGYLDKNMLYYLDEKQIVKIINSIKEQEILGLWKTFLTTKEIIGDDDLCKKQKENYYVSINTKKRYVDPIFVSDNGVVRLTTVKYDYYNKIEEYKKNQGDKWIYVKKYQQKENK